MGIFSFLKGLGKEEEIEKEPEDLVLTDIDARINSFSKNVLDNLDQELVDIRKKIDEEKTKIKKNLLLMEEKEPENKNLPERARGIIDGNKKSYAIKIKGFIEIINIPEDIKDVPNFCDGFNESLDNFGKKTIKNFGVLQQFFGDNTKAISISINNINSSVKKAKEIVESSDVESMKELRDNLDDINKTIEMKEQIKKEIEIAKEKKKKYDVDLKERKTKIKSLETGDKHKSFVELSTKEESLKKELKEVEHQLSSDFLYILPSLKKYERLTLDFALVKDYMKNHSKALQKDEDIKIVGVLDKIQGSIKNGKLELKDKKKDRMLKALSRMDKGYFEEFIARSGELKKILLD